MTGISAELTADRAESGTERILAEVMADLMSVEQVPVDSHFFDDLGADSLVMAHFCARVRKRADLPSVSMKDIYRHPTLRGLATALADAAPASAASRAPAPAEAAASVRTREYVLCGTLQLLFFLGYAWVAALAGARAYGWISSGSLTRQRHRSIHGKAGATAVIMPACGTQQRPGSRCCQRRSCRACRPAR